MSTELLVLLTVVEIVLLVAVLALYLIALTKRLHATADILGQLTGGVDVIAGNVALVGAGAAILNRKLDTISGVLPLLAEKAESVAASS
ncbi:MAG TPA: hypothetical protein VGM60_23695 [Pseudonocardia sp.]|uniref:hypothetical protein n=1 Tax=Pseudonocardia sp. TaxID=60912 RepID=UPI002F3F4A64